MSFKFNKQKFVFLLVCLVVILGISFYYLKGSEVSQKIVGDLVFTEAKEDPNVILYYKDGNFENWYASIDLSDFNGKWRNEVYDYGNYLYADNNNTILSIFGEKIEGVNSLAQCSEYKKEKFVAFLNLFKEKFKDKLATGEVSLTELKETDYQGGYLYSYVVSLGGKKTQTFDYIDYYDGYCFDHHISDELDKNGNAKVAEKILSSIGMHLPLQ